MRFGDAQVGEQKGGGLGLRGRAAVGEEFWFHIDEVAKFLAAFPDFIVLVQDPVHGAYRAVVDERIDIREVRQQLAA